MRYIPPRKAMPSAEHPLKQSLLSVTTTMQMILRGVLGEESEAKHEEKKMPLTNKGRKIMNNMQRTYEGKRVNKNAQRWQDHGR